MRAERGKNVNLGNFHKKSRISPAFSTFSFRFLGAEPYEIA